MIDSDGIDLTDFVPAINFSQALAFIDYCNNIIEHCLITLTHFLSIISSSEICFEVPLNALRRFPNR